MPTLAELRRQSILEDRQRKKNSWTYDYTPQQQPQEETGVLENLWNGAKNIVKAGVGADNVVTEMGANALDYLGDTLKENSVLPNNFLGDLLKAGAQHYRRKADTFDWLVGGTENVTPANYNDWSSAIPNAVAGTVANMGSGFGRMVHSDDSAQKLETASKSLNPQSQPEVGLNGDYFGNPAGAAYDLFSGLTSTAMLAPMMMLAPETLALRAAAKFGGDKLVSGLLGTGSSALRRKMAKYAAENLPTMLRYAPTAAIGEGLVEGGNVRKENLAQGMSDAEATANSIKAALANAGYLTASNALESALFFSPLRGKGVLDKGRKILTRALIGGGNQSTEEAVQQMIENAYTGRPLTENVESSFKHGIVPGLALGGLGAGYQARNRNENDVNYQQGADNNYSVEDYGNIYDVRKRLQDAQDAQSQADFNSYSPQGDSDLVGWAVNKSGGSESTAKKIISIANEEGVDPRVALAVGIAESNLNQDAVSPVGALGVMQLMPETAESLGVNPNNEDENIRGGVKFLKQMLDMFDGDVEKAVAAYNAGPGAVQRYNGVPPYAETQNYAGKIMGMLGESPEYSGGGNQEQADIYTGENGQAEGKYWNRQGGNVSFDGAQPDLLNAVDMLAKWYFDKTGKKLVVTAGTNGDHPSNGSEHGHDAGWKVDVNDWGFGEEGALTADGGGKGYLTDEFIAYGRSLGLGMNWEGDHIDVALDGTQWDGNGENAGGFNPSRNVSSPAPSPSRTLATSLPTESAETEFDIEESESEFKPIKFSDDDELTQQLFDEFANGKRQDSEDKNLFADVFNQDNNFINTQENRDAVQKDFGEEFDKFLQSKGYKLASDETAPKIKTQTQEQPKPQQGKVEFDEIKPPEKKYLNSDLVSQAKLLSEYAQQKKDGVLWHKVDQAIKNRNESEMQTLVRDNPLPAEFVKSQQAEETSENPISETTPAENKKSKVEIPAKTLAIARAPVDMNNSDARKRQGEALLEIAKLNKFEVDKTLERTSKNGYKKAVPQLKALLEEQGFLNDNGEVKETAADKHKKLCSEYDAKQKELDAAYHAVKEIPADTIDIMARRKALRNFDRLLNERNATREKLWESTREVNEERRQNINAPKSDYRKVEADYQNEIDEISDQMKTVREQGLKLEGEERKVKAKEFKELEKQKKSLTADLHKFQKSAAHLEDLRGKLAEVEDFIEEGEKNTKLTKQRDALQKKISALEKELEINQPETAAPEKVETPLQENVQPTQTQQEKFAPPKIEEQPQEISKPVEVESQPAKPVQQQNQDFDDIQQQTKQILENIKAQESNPQKAETTPPTSKKTYHFDGTPNERTSETAEGILKSLPTIHSKLKTDSHPNLKRFVDEQEKILRENSNDEDAKGELQNILSRKFTDEDLQSFEDEAKPVENIPETQETSTAPNEKISEVEETPKKSESKIKSRPAGKSEKILTDSQKPVETHYKVVSADELIPSHEWNGDAVFENKNYPADEKLQPRESRKGSAMTINAIKRANNLNPELLTDSKNVNQGAPLVRNDGVVLNGNGRILSINRAYKNGKADGYKKHLIDNAEKFGLNAEEISKIENPVLIREVNQELTPELTNEIINSKTGGESFNDTELAREDAKKISFKPIKKYVEGGTLDDLYYDVANDVVPESERNKYFRDGGLTTSGLNRAKNALFAKAYGEEGLLNDIANSGEEFSQNLQDALLESAPHIIQANKNRPNYRIGEIISDAAKKYVELKKKRKNVAAYIKEERETDSMFNPQRAAELDIIEEINDKVGNKNKLRSFFRDIANKIIAEENEKSGMFQSEEADKRVDEIVAYAKKKSAESQGQSLFDVEENPDVAITDDMLVDDKDLTSQQKTFTEISRELNFETKYFTGDARFKGVLRKGTSYINVNNKNFEQTFYHEMAHYLSYFNPELFNEILETVPITEEQLQAIRDRSPLYENLSERQLKEEILADNFMDFSKRAGFLREVGKQNKSLAEKIVSWLKSLMDKFTGFFSNPKGGLTRTQREAMYKSFKRNIDSIVDGNGNKIFRMSNATFEIQRANGEKLPPMDLQMFGENSVDRQEILTDNQKKDLFDTIKQHIDDYISEQTKSGKNQSEVAKELTAENSRHRARTLGALKATLRDFENRANDKQHRRITVERIHGKKNWSDAKVDEKYQTMTDNLREMVDYGGVLYHEIALHRAGTQGMSGKGVQLLSWADAERQRAEREGAIFKENGVDKKHSEKNQGAFSMDRYSIDPSDNSNEGWKTKVANWFLGRPVERLNREITKMLGKTTDLKILYRHFSGDAAVVLDELHGVLRAKHAYKWDEILPVVGKRISEKLNLQPSDKMNNFIAEWLLNGALNNTSTERTQFERAMREKPDFAESLTEIQEKFRAYANMDALEQYKTHIGGDSEGKIRKIIRAKQEGTLVDRITEELVDDLNPLKKIDERFEKLFGVKLAENETVYNLARMYKGTSGIVRNLIRAKTDAEVKASIDALKKIYPNVNFEKFVPLQKIISNIGGEKYIEDFEAYCLACLDKEMYEKNRELEAKARAKGKTLEEKDKYKPVESEEKADKAIRAGKDRFGQAQQDLVNFSNTILEISHDSGFISDKQYEHMKENWKNYIPTHRIFDEADTIELADSMKHKRGSDRDIVHPIRVIVRNTAFFVDQAEKNRVKQELAAKIRLGSFGDLVSEEEFRNGNEPTIDFKENGKVKHLAVTPEIKRAVDSLSGDRTQAAYVFKVFHAASRIVSNLYTAASPDFAVGNIFRDAQESYLYNDKAKALSLSNNPIANLIRAFKFLFNSFRQPPEYTAAFYEWQAMGGGQSSFVSFDMDSTKDLVDDVARTRAEKWISQPFTQVLKSLQEFSERLETANRLAVYEQTKGILSKQNADGKATESDMRRAAFASRNATIDFARGGRSMREVNKYFRFSNVAVQDLAKSATLLKTLDPRNLKTKEGRQKALDTIIKIGFLVLTTAALFMKNHDEDWYKHGTQQWQKDTSWILSDGVKIPKSYSFIGKLTSTLTEEFLKNIVDNEPIKARRLLSPLGEALPALMPTLLTPIVEAVSNYSFFYGGQLVPQKEMRLPAHMQYNEKTGWLAKEIGGSAPAKFLSEMLFGNSEGFSPRKIDHVINGYLGFPGRLFFGQYSQTLDESPMAKRFLFDPYKNPQIVQDYYNKRSEQERFFNEYKQNRKEGKNEKPDGYDEKLYRRIKSAETAMKNISEKERKLIANSKIPADQLKKQLQELEERRIKLCKKVFGYS